LKDRTPDESAPRRRAPGASIPASSIPTVSSEAEGSAAAGPRYGEGDASYRAAGGREGLERLVDAFYRHMDEQPFARGIRRMHPRDLTIARDKLTLFLSGWLNGPSLYAAKYGPIRIPSAHAHLRIGPRERDAWLRCMELAIAEQDYAPDFAEYLLRALGVPAERVRQTSRDPIAGDDEEPA
jgi:hemoglobin